MDRQLVTLRLLIPGGGRFSLSPYAPTEGDVVASRDSWSGWIGFAGLLMVIIGILDFFEGLIAIIRGEYYVIHGNQLIVFDTTTWGWITLVLGILLFFAGFGLLSRAGWARWFAIVLIVVNLVEQLGWLGNSSYPLWTLILIALQIIVLFALTARWREDEGVAV
jgi:hypothetical protein